MKNREKWIVEISLLIVFAFSLTALCCSCPRNTCLEFDYLGVIIGVLSFLVAFITIIFGYNIYSLRDNLRKEQAVKIDDIKKEQAVKINNLKNEISAEIDTLGNEVSGNMFFRVAELEYELKKYTLAFQNYIMSAHSFYKYDPRLETIDVCINRLNSTIYEMKKSNDPLTFLRGDKSRLIEMVYEIDRNDTNVIIEFLTNDVKGV
jgi:hypothetical protein|nr:MAG TPA: hypothetical protein [Caudoviricetes sp.]